MRVFLFFCKTLLWLNSKANHDKENKNEADAIDMYGRRGGMVGVEEDGRRVMRTRSRVEHQRTMQLLLRIWKSEW